MYKKISFLFLATVCSTFILVALPKATFIPQDLSMQNAGKTRQFKGLNFSMNKKGHAIAVWAVSDPDVPTDGAIQAAYFDGSTWDLPGVDEFISLTDGECCLPWVHLNDNDQAVAVWHQNADKKIRASRFINKMWQTPEDVASLDPGADFDPTQGRVRVGISGDAPNAKAFVIWLQKNADTTYTLFYNYNQDISADTWDGKTPILVDSPNKIIIFHPLISSLCIGTNYVSFTLSVDSNLDGYSKSINRRFSFLTDTLTTGMPILDAPLPFECSAAATSCSNNDSRIFSIASTQPLLTPPKSTSEVEVFPADSDRFSSNLTRFDNKNSDCFYLASGINDDIDTVFLQIHLNKEDASTLLYIKQNTGKNSPPCLTFDGFNDIPQLCMNNRGDGAFIYYNEPIQGANGKIGIGGFRKQGGSFSCTSMPHIFNGATLKKRTDIADNLPFYLDCARNEGGQNNSYGGIIWWNETEETKIIQSLIVQNTNTPFTPSSPTDSKAVQYFNRFAFQGEYFNTLTWVPATDTGITKQLVQRNGIVIATLSPIQDSFIDHNRPATAKDEYGIITVVSAGGSEYFSVPAAAVPSC